MINQVLYSLFKKRLISSIEHYSQNEIVGFYKKYNDLANDEEDVLNYISKNLKQGSSVLVIGAGAGREVHRLLNLKFKLYAYEPVLDLLNSIDSSVIKISNQSDLFSFKYDSIWITKNLLSLVSNNQRKELYQLLKNISCEDTMIFINGDIFDVHPKNSLKFYFSHYFLRLFVKGIQPGDVIRSNIDFGAHNNNLLIYHYFKSEDMFKFELEKMLGIKSFQKINGTFYKGLFK